MDTGMQCVTCGDLVARQRARRVRVTAEVTALMPGANVEELREASERGLRTQWEWDAVQQAVEQERAAAARSSREAVYAQARAEAEAAEQARQAMPCAACRAPQAGGLCGTCTTRQKTRDLITEAARIAVAGRVDPADTAGVIAELATEEARLRRIAQAAAEQLYAAHEVEDEAASAWGAAHAALYAVQDATTGYRHTALEALATSPEADAEASQAHAAALRNARATRPAAARPAADQARVRTARYLLDTRLAILQMQHGGPRQAA